MREIKFRAKPVYKGGKIAPWVYGTFKYIPCNVVSPGATDNGRRELRHDKGIIIDSYYHGETEVLCDTVGQYTGCRDHSGKPIYEGDIVECVSWNEYFSKDGQPMEPFRRKMYVDFRKGAFVMVEPMPEPLQDHEWPIIYNGDITIIGNRFDNPELIANKSLG